VILNACDPLNLTGVVIRGARVPAVRTNSVVYVDGVPEMPDVADVPDPVPAGTKPLAPIAGGGGTFGP
jgi:hypothetical protein